MNLYKVRSDRGPAGDLFRSAQKQAPNYQGIWILDGEGKVVGSHVKFKSHETWPRELLADLEAALKAFGPVEPRSVKREDPLPHRGRGVQPDGTYCLAVHASVLYQGKRLNPPILDSILLTADDLEAFRPPDVAAGAEWTVREPVARKFSRALSGSADTGMMPNPEDVKAVELKATVESVTAGLVKVRLKGAWEATRMYPSGTEKRPTLSSSKAEGRAVYDAEKKELKSLLLVFDGTWRPVPPYDAPKHAASVVEWAR